jgi:endonuclease/exonuclease/phosphatase family metal-dependent hydrolase
LSFFSRTIVFFNALAALCSVLAYCAPHVPPLRLWWVEYFGLGALLLIFIHLLFVLFWAMKRSKWLAISLCTLIIGYPLNRKILQINLHKTPTPQAQTLKIMTLNVGLFSYPNWSRHEKDQQEILDFCKTQQPDVVCFQEFQANNPGMGDINDRLLQQVFNSGYFARTINHNGVVHTGIAIFSKYPIINKKLYEFKQKRSTNACMFVDIKLKNDTVRIFAIHLQSLKFKDEDFETIRNLEQGENALENTSGIKNILRKVKSGVEKRSVQAQFVAQKIKESPYKVIVCGDFNDAPTTYAYQTISQNLQDTFVERGTGTGYTYAGPLPFLRIDYILTSKKFKILSHKVYKEPFSDHFPVIASVEILNNP